MKRQYYSKQFKLEALRLLEHSGKAGAELAREPGVRRNQLYKWRVAQLEEENAILKKAAAYFTKKHR